MTRVSTPDLRLRPAVRVLLVDPFERVLTMRWELSDGRGAWEVEHRHPGGSARHLP